MLTSNSGYALPAAITTGITIMMLLIFLIYTVYNQIMESTHLVQKAVWMSRVNRRCIDENNRKVAVPIDIKAFEKI